MILDELYNVVSHLIEETEDVDTILKSGEIQLYKLTEIMGKTDQEIDEFVKQKENDKKKQELLFEVFQKIRLEQSIENISDRIAAEEDDNNKEHC